MANPLYQQLMGGARAPMPTGNIAGLMQQVNPCGCNPCGGGF